MNKPHTEESKQKMREAALARYAGHAKGAPRPCRKCGQVFEGVRCKPCTYAKNKEYRDRRKDHLPSSKHRLTPAQSRDLIEAQDGVCAACKQPPTGKGHHAVLHIDHDHATGAIRGALCATCNMALGLLKDSPERLSALIDYLWPMHQAHENKKTGAPAQWKTWGHVGLVRSTNHRMRLVSFFSRQPRTEE